MLLNGYGILIFLLSTLAFDNPMKNYENSASNFTFITCEIFSMRFFNNMFVPYNQNKNMDKLEFYISVAYKIKSSINKLEKKCTTLKMDQRCCFFNEKKNRIRQSFFTFCHCKLIFFIFDNVSYVELYKRYQINKKNPLTKSFFHRILYEPLCKIKKKRKKYFSG